MKAASKTSRAAVAAITLWCALVWANAAQIYRLPLWLELLPLWLPSAAAGGVTVVLVPVLFVLRVAAWRAERLDRQRRERIHRDFVGVMQRGTTYRVRQTAERIEIIEERRQP